MSDWVRPRPDARGYRNDAILAVVILVGASLSALLHARVGYVDEVAPVWLSAVTLAALALPLALRRRYPEAVAVAVSVAFYVAMQFFVPELLVTNIALFIAIYSVGAWSASRKRAHAVRILIIVGMFVWVGVNLVLTTVDPDLLPGFSRSGIFSQLASYALLNLLTNALFFGGAYYFGDVAWKRAKERHDLETRTRELAAAREHATAQAIALDRVSIARELHDVVAHHVSVMGIQAGAARRVLEKDPATASESLAIVEHSARSAVEELHRLLTTLRSADIPDAPDAASTLGVSQLPELADASTRSGVPTALTIVGEPHPISPLVGYTVYRVTQEALTNTRKHGGVGATADVRVRYLGDTVELEVADTGVGLSLAAASGLGHVGMHERVSAVGGELTVGPRARGGYLVRARIPTGVSA